MNMKIKLNQFIKKSLRYIALTILISGMLMNNLSIMVMANTGDDEGITIDSLINDPLLEVTGLDFNKPHDDRTPADIEWEQLLASNKPLIVNESYTESFDNSFFKMRLRPYTPIYYTPDVPSDATFEFIDDNGSKSVLMKTNGSKGGAFDYIEFSGMKFVEGATYSLTVNYTVITPNRGFKMGFGPNSQVPYFMDLGGSETGQKKTETAEFASNTPNGLGADVHAAIILMVAGGDDPASIQIDSMTITRLSSKPVLINPNISGASNVGNTLTLNFTYYQDSNIKEGATDIIWFIASDETSKNMLLISSSKGKKSLFITNEMAGYYIGAMVTPKTINPDDNGIGDTQIVMAKNPVGSVIRYDVVNIDTEGKSLLEDFEDIKTSGNISFTPDSGAYAYITDDISMAISGKSLVVKNPGPGVIKGGIFGDVTFGGDKSIVVSFKYKFIDKAPSNLYIQFRALSQGYSADVNQNISSPQVGAVREFMSKPFKLGNFNDYFMQMFDGYGPYTIVIDDLKVESVIPTIEIPAPPAPPVHPKPSALDVLASVGETFTEDFTKNDIGSLWSYDNSHFSVVVGSDAIDGKSIKQDFTNANNGSIYAFDTKGKLVAGGKYRLTVNYKYLTDTAPTGFYFGFTRDGGANQKNIQVDFSGKQKNTVYTFTADYTLDNFGDYYLQWFNLNGKDGSIIVIDNLTIERMDDIPAATPETPSDTSTLDDLAVIGSMFTENFTKNAIGSLWSYDNNHFSVVEDAQAIAGKSIKQDFTNANNGSIYAFDTKGKLAAGGKYRLTVNYKYLTDTAPTGFYFGFTRDGGANQKNIQVDFSGKQKNTVYTFTADYTLDDFGDYYLQWFNLDSKDGSIMVIDTLILERLDNTPPPVTLNDLITIGKTYIEDFLKNNITPNTMGAANVWATNISDANAINGDSLYIKTMASTEIFFFELKDKLAANATYSIQFKYRVLNAPPEGVYGLPGFYLGMRLDGGGADFTQLDMLNKTDGSIYTSSVFNFNTGDSTAYYPEFYINNATPFEIIIDDFTITRIM